MPDAEMIRHYGSIEVACNVYRHNHDHFVRSLIFSRHPALRVKRGAK